MRGQLANASNMLDVTWEAPDGTITPLDGYLDPYFQEVYLEAGSIPIFSKLAKHVSADALDDYVAQLEKEVNKYLNKDLNYGKAAKRMYNIFRLTGRYEEAAFIRELFDEPATVLYQVWSLIRTLDDALQPGSDITLETLRRQADRLIVEVERILEGTQEIEIVRRLAAAARHAGRPGRAPGLDHAGRGGTGRGHQPGQQLLPRQVDRACGHPHLHRLAPACLRRDGGPDRSGGRHPTAAGGGHRPGAPGVAGQHAAPDRRTGRQAARP